MATQRKWRRRWRASQRPKGQGIAPRSLPWALGLGLGLAGLAGLTGAWAISVTGSHLAVAAIYIAAGAVLGVAWGRDVAAFWIAPLTTSAVVGDAVGGSEVQPGFYGAAAQVGPVLLLAIGLEQWSLSYRGRTVFERTLFAAVLGYVAIAEVAALYGAAVCSAASTGCVDALIVFDAFAGWQIAYTAANVTAAGFAAGLVAILLLALISSLDGERGDAQRPGVARNRGDGAEGGGGGAIDSGEEAGGAGAPDESSAP